MKKPIRALAFLSLSVAMSACSMHTKPHPDAPKPGPEHAWTHEEKMQYMSDMFINRMDTNKDGEISRAEYNKHAANWFKEADTDHNGRLTQEEVSAQFEREKEKMKADHRMCRDNWSKDKPHDGEHMSYDRSTDKWNDDIRSDR